MFSESGHRLSDFRNRLIVLPATSSHPLPLLEDLPDGSQADQEEGDGSDGDLWAGEERCFWRCHGW